MSAARREAELFFNALRFFTRLPVPAWVGHSEDLLNHAARYFPLVGVVVGLIAAAAYQLAAWVLPATIAIVLSMALTLLATGAFHEDGFADACDGFGGGWDKAQVLAIMKDSRIGAYGAIGITLMLLAKFLALHELADESVAIALIVAHPMSRLASTALIYSMTYVRADADSRAKPLAHRLTRAELLLAAAPGLAPMLLLAPLAALCAALLVAATTLAFGRYLARRIGGYTGDCLGAAQQLAELAAYLGILIAWSFISSATPGS